VLRRYKEVAVKYRKHSDFVVSEVGVGCFGLSGAYGSKDVDEYRKMIERAFEMGVNFFDTSGTYPEAEQLLGEVFAPFRQHVYIATKVGVKRGIKPDLSASYIQFACQQSLERLQTDYIDLYQVQFEDPDTPIAATVAALDHLVKSGAIRRYGIGHLSPESVETYMQYGRVFSVQMELSAVERFARRRILPLCERNKVAGIAFSVTGRGLLSGQIEHDTQFDQGDIRNVDPLFRRARFDSGLRVAEKLAEVSRRLEKTPAQAAIAWVLAQPCVTCAVPGPSTVAHLEEDVGGSGWHFPEETLEEFEAFLRKEDAWLDHAEREAIRKILSSPLNGDASRACNDLLYAVETSVLIGLVGKEEAFPLRVDLVEARKSIEAGGAPALDRIRTKLSEIIQPEMISNN
jgi:aryl-alcohol dehydrogenase-like predicted oxidoreductase